MSTDVLEAFRDLKRSLSRAALVAFAETGAGPTQVQLLRELRAGAVSQADLARATFTEPAALMRAIDALERRGWTRRESCPDDRRRKLVSLTAEGRRAAAALDRAYETLRSGTNRALTRAERAQFCALAAKVAGRLDALGAAAPADPA